MLYFCLHLHPTSDLFSQDTLTVFMAFSSSLVHCAPTHLTLPILTKSVAHMNPPHTTLLQCKFFQTIFKYIHDNKC